MAPYNTRQHYESPTVSAIVRTGGKPTLVVEGFSWQEVITRVYGFRITASDRILSLKNLCAKDATPVNNTLCSSDNEFLFLLVPDEIVTSLEVYKTDHVITAVRFTTNKRVSQWFGKPTGFRTELRTDCDVCINAIQTRYSTDGCTQLNVVYLPLSVIESEYSSRALARRQPIQLSSVAVDSAVNTTAPFVSYCQTPRAIAFKAGISVFDIDVLSPAEYQRYTTAYHLWKSMASQHMLVLTGNERIQAVGVAVVDENLQAICLKTNAQTTQWFGKAVPADATWFDCQGRPGCHICGFQLVGRYITGIGVVYSVPERSSSSVAMATSPVICADDPAFFV